MEPLSHNLGPELAQALLRTGIKKQYAANEQIFSESDQATFLPVVLAGKVKMVRYPEVGKEVILGIFQAGDLFAIPPAMDGKLFPATAVAIEDSQLLMVQRQDFLELMKTSPEFSSIVMARMCGILRDRADTVQILATPSAEHRIASVVLRLATEAGNGGSKKIEHRRQDIAEMAGITLETTIRMIRKLEDRGFFRIVRGKIYVDTTDQLRDFLR